jgi:hypothetical protein
MALQPGINRLAFERQDAEDAFVNAPQGLLLDELFEPFDAQRELSESQRSLPGEARSRSLSSCSGDVYSGP